jgi:hypothetical protein
VDGTPGTNDMPGRLVFSTTADGAASPTERMRITNAGNVGIGTATPASLLHLSANEPGLQWQSTGSAITYAVGVYGRWYVYDITNSAERLTISNTGNVGIGTASPSYLLDVNGTARITGALTLTTALTAANGGTGLTSPGTSGNVLTSNGTAWVSSSPAASGVTLATARQVASLRL